MTVKGGGRGQGTRRREEDERGSVCENRQGDWREEEAGGREVTGYLV